MRGWVVNYYSIITRRCGGMVDTRDLKSLVGNNVPVRVRSPAPKSAAPLRGAADFGQSVKEDSQICELFGIMGEKEDRRGKKHGIVEAG